MDMNHKALATTSAQDKLYISIVAVSSLTHFLYLFLEFNDTFFGNLFDRCKQGWLGKYQRENEEFSKNRKPWAKVGSYKTYKT